MKLSSETATRLRDIEIFVGLGDADYDWLCSAAEICHLPDGVVLLEDGAHGNYFYVLLSGQLVVTKLLYGHEQFLARFVSPVPEKAVGDMPSSANVFTGELPLLTGGPNFATVRVCGQAELLRYTRDSFFEMLARFPSVLRAMLPALVWRVKAAEAHARNQGITAALGTMAAGLAHEIDNPAAAIMRAAEVLDSAFSQLVTTTLNWGALGTPAEREALTETVAAISGRDRAAADDKAADGLYWWARERGVTDPAGLADALASRDISAGWLEGRLGAVRDSVTVTALDHLGAVLEVSEPLADIRTTITRITALVAAACSYASLGRAPRRDFSVTEGLDATLAMLRGRLRDIEVACAYQSGLPPLVGYPSELNQVWTHLIENAIDAMEGSGTITITVSHQADSLFVEVTDTGTGIPPESLDRIFHPFFTTKEIGQGTGLGLHFAHQIVAQRHGGSMSVRSVPGETHFSVRLPISRS